MAALSLIMLVVIIRYSWYSVLNPSVVSLKSSNAKDGLPLNNYHVDRVFPISIYNFNELSEFAEFIEKSVNI